MEDNSKMPYDAIEAKRYVLRELMEMMDKNEREKLKGSFKPDSQPWETERATTETDMHSDLAGKMLPGSVAKDHTAAEGVDEIPPSTGSSSDNDEDNEPVADSANEYSRRRYKK